MYVFNDRLSIKEFDKRLKDLYNKDKSKFQYVVELDFVFSEEEYDDLIKFMSNYNYFDLVYAFYEKFHNLDGAQEKEAFSIKKEIAEEIITNDIYQLTEDCQDINKECDGDCNSCYLADRVQIEEDELLYVIEFITDVTDYSPLIEKAINDAMILKYGKEKAEKIIKMDKELIELIG